MLLQTQAGATQCLRYMVFLLLVVNDSFSEVQGLPYLQTTHVIGPQALLRSELHCRMDVFPTSSGFFWTSKT
jgi:hypothetical protein